MTQTPILIDTDAGEDVDDVLAIAFALRKPELAVKAITTVSHGTARRAAIVKRLVDAAGYAPVAIGAGMELPLRSISPVERAQMTNDEYVLNHAPAVPFDGAVDAVSLIIETVEANAGEIVVVAIGPLTNIACALTLAPWIAPKIKAIALMGGEVAIYRQEHNIYWDYVAASTVFSSGVPLFMGTWSVTREFTLSPEDCETIKGIGTPMATLLGECIDLWWPHKGGKPGPVMYDIAPIIWTMGGAHYTTEQARIRVETRGEYTSGITVMDYDGDRNVAVSVSMDANAVKRLYLETLLG